MPKQVRGTHKNKAKSISSAAHFNSTDKETPLWSFEKIDRDGAFCFRKDTVDAALVVEKLIDIGSLSWASIGRVTHDDGQSKHHELAFHGISDAGKERIRVKRMEQDIDAIFSFALTNKVRLIGMREGRVFYVIWYDPEHQFYPVAK
jgi:hypothetical protein